MDFVTRGIVTGDPLPSVPDIPAVLEQYGKARGDATFLSATDSKAFSTSVRVQVSQLSHLLSL